MRYGCSEPKSRYDETMDQALRNLPTSGELPRHSRTVVEIVDEQVQHGERTLTPLGEKLLDARRLIERSGIPLLDREELDRERAERRGGTESH